MRLFCVCVVLCLGKGLATGLSLVQGVLPSVKNDYGTEKEGLNGLEEPLKKKSDDKLHEMTENSRRCVINFSC
jgi:hypothetical protein